MNTSRWIITALSLALIVAISGGWNTQERRALGQEGGETRGIGRYRIEAFGTGGNISGCYIVDSVTGELWLSSNDRTTKKIVDKLP